MSHAPITPRLLTAPVAASYLSVPVAELQRLGVGRVQIGLRVRYDRVRLDEYLDGRKPGAAESVANGDDPDAALARFTQNFRHASRRS